MTSINEGVRSVRPSVRQRPSVPASVRPSVPASVGPSRPRPSSSSVSLSLRPFVRRPPARPRSCLCPPVRPSVRPSLRPSVPPSAPPSVRLFVPPSLRPSCVRSSFGLRASVPASVRPSLRLSVLPSVFPSLGENHICRFRCYDAVFDVRPFAGCLKSDGQKKGHLHLMF